MQGHEKQVDRWRAHFTSLTAGRVVMREPEQIAAQRVALGRCLASHRERSGLSQQELAERLCYDRTSIAKIEAGQQPAPRAFWCEADRLLGAGGELVTGFDALAGAKTAVAMASNGRTDALVDALATAMLPVARASDKVRSTSADSDQVDAVIELEALSRALAEHSRRVLMGESGDWAEITERLSAAATACQRQIVIEPCATWLFDVTEDEAEERLVGHRHRDHGAVALGTEPERRGA